uniref:F-box domain-containing protein n=1 Tax=Parastrongyloides trichosuri TaxID=131310 RepID=A0A0N4ZSG6_PARTI
MSLQSLPNELIAKIFSYLRQEDLKNVRYVTRNFHYIIEEHIYLMDKPEVSEVVLESVSNEEGNEKFRVEFLFFFIVGEQKISKDVKRNNISISEVQYFLKKLKFKDLCQLRIKLKKSHKMLDIFNFYIKHGIEVTLVRIDIDQCPIMDSFMQFLSHLRSVKSLNIDNLCVYPLKPGSSCILPSIKDLQNVWIKECICGTFINEPMIIKLLLSHPNIEGIGITCFGNNFHMKLINHILKMQNCCNSITRSSCSYPFFSYGIVSTNKDINFEEVKNKCLQNISYIWNIEVNERRNHFWIFGLKFCEKCLKTVHIQIMLKIEDCNRYCGGLTNNTMGPPQAKIKKL